MTLTEAGLPALDHLAYSQEPPAAATQRVSWWWVIDRAALCLVLLLLAAAGIVVAGVLPPAVDVSAPPMAIPSSAPPAPDALPLAPLPAVPDAASMANPDTVYVAALRDLHSDLTVTDDTGYTFARGQCAAVAGRGVAGAVTWLTQHYAGLTDREASDVVRAAVRAYCPQYDKENVN
jgi:hypothetical protein